MSFKNPTRLVEKANERAKLKELIEDATKEINEAMSMKNYNISFYTLEDMQNNAEPTYYIEDATSHDIDIIDTLIDNDKEHNFAHFDGAIIDLNQFAVIRYEEEEDEE